MKRTRSRGEFDHVLKMLSRTDLERLYSCAREYGLSRDDVDDIVRNSYNVKTIHLSSRLVKMVLVLIKTEGNLRREQAEREELAKFERGELERDRVRAIRESKHENYNRKKKAAKMARLAKRGK